MKKRIGYLMFLNNYFVHQFVDNFPSLLLRKINAIDFIDMNDLKKNFISRNTEILIESNYGLGMYVCTCHTSLTRRKTMKDMFFYIIR